MENYAFAHEWQLKLYFALVCNFTIFYAGYDGIYCDNEINECDSSPCQNGGVCVDKLASYLCACGFGYTGKHNTHNHKLIYREYYVD